MTAETALRPATLLLEDGDLEDLRSTLGELGFAVARPGEEPAGAAAVLLSSPRCALARLPLGCQRRHFHIIVTERMSSGLRREIDRVRPDFILERPIDPGVLGLLIQHALYTGPEKRRGPRVPLRESVRCRIGRVSRSATLLELSEGGCRLATKRSLERNQLLTVVLPPELMGGSALALEARVVGTARGNRPGPSSISFLPHDAATRAALRRLVAERVVTSGALHPRKLVRAVPAPSTPDEAPRPSGPDEAPRPSPAGPPARRREPRAAYRRSVLASGAGSAHVLVGRDLSSGGMRVDPDPLLVVGQELKLVIHGSAGRPPVVVKASVARNEGEDGCVLRFHGLSAEARSRLEAIVRALPNARPADAGVQGPNVVVSEVVELGA